MRRDLPNTDIAVSDLGDSASPHIRQLHNEPLKASGAAQFSLCYSCSSHSASAIVNCQLSSPCRQYDDMKEI
jgi:hypothetical protein